MLQSDNLKFSCESCTRGHRAYSCCHFSAITAGKVFLVNERGKRSKRKTYDRYRLIGADLDPDANMRCKQTGSYIYACTHFDGCCSSVDVVRLVENSLKLIKVRPDGEEEEFDAEISAKELQNLIYRFTHIGYYSNTYEPPFLTQCSTDTSSKVTILTPSTKASQHTNTNIMSISNLVHGNDEIDADADIEDFGDDFISGSSFNDFDINRELSQLRPFGEFHPFLKNEDDTILIENKDSPNYPNHLKHPLGSVYPHDISDSDTENPYSSDFMRHGSLDLIENTLDPSCTSGTPLDPVLYQSPYTSDIEVLKLEDLWINSRQDLYDQYL